MSSYNRHERDRDYRNQNRDRGMSKSRERNRSEREYRPQNRPDTRINSPPRDRGRSRSPYRRLSDRQGSEGTPPRPSITGAETPRRPAPGAPSARNHSPAVVLSIMRPATPGTSKSRLPPATAAQPPAAPCAPLPVWPQPGGSAHARTSSNSSSSSSLPARPGQHPTTPKSAFENELTKLVPLVVSPSIRSLDLSIQMMKTGQALLALIHATSNSTTPLPILDPPPVPPSTDDLERRLRVKMENDLDRRFAEREQDHLALLERQREAHAAALAAQVDEHRKTLERMDAAAVERVREVVQAKLEEKMQELEDKVLCSQMDQPAPAFAPYTPAADPSPSGTTAIVAARDPTTGLWTDSSPFLYGRFRAFREELYNQHFPQLRQRSKQEVAELHKRLDALAARLDACPVDSPRKRAREDSADGGASALENVRVELHTERDRINDLTNRLQSAETAVASNGTTVRSVRDLANSYNVNTKSEFESVQGKIEDAIRAATGGLVKVEAMREYVVSEVADAVNSRVEEIVGLNSLRKSPSNVKPDLDSTRIVKLEELDEAIATALKTSVPSHLRSRLEAVESLANQLEVLEAQTYGMDTNLDARIVGLAQKEIAKDLQHLVEDELSHALTPMRLANLVQTSFAGKRETGEKLNECERRFSDVESRLVGLDKGHATLLADRERTMLFLTSLKTSLGAIQPELSALVNRQNATPPASPDGPAPDADAL